MIELFNSNLTLSKQLELEKQGLLKSLEKFNPQNYDFELFLKDNELIKQWFKQHIREISNYLKDKQESIILEANTLQITGSRCCDIAYPESDIDYGIITDDKRIFDAVCTYYQTKEVQNTLEFSKLKVTQTAAGLSLGTIDEITIHFSNGQTKKLSLEFVLRSPSQHIAIQNAAKKYFEQLSVEAKQYYAFNMRRLYKKYQLATDATTKLQYKDVMNLLKTPLKVLSAMPIITNPYHLFAVTTKQQQSISDEKQQPSPSFGHH